MEKDKSFELDCSESFNHKSVLDHSVPSARVKINYSGICGSDVHTIHGMGFHTKLKNPKVLGHEASGTILEICGSFNDSDPTLKKGDHVTINPIISCGKCEMCKEGKTNLCLNRKLLGSDVDGLLQEIVTVPLNNISKLDSSVELSLGALTEPLAVAVHTVKIASENGLEPGQDVLIFGAGKISLFISLVLKKLMNPKTITVIGLNKDVEFRFPIFNENGIVTYTFNQLFGRNGEVLDHASVKGKYNVVFEVSGSENGISGAFSYTRNRGNIIAVGLTESDIRFNSNILVRKEFKLIGSDSYLRDDFEDAISFISNGMIKVEWVKFYDVEKCKDAFLKYENSEVMAILFNF